MVNVSLFPGGPKGAELGEEIGRGASEGPASGGGASAPEGPEQSQAGTGRAGQCSPLSAGVGHVTLGKSLSPWGLSFPEFAQGVSTVQSEQMAPVHHGKEQMERELLQPSASPVLLPLLSAPRPPLPVFCLDQKRVSHSNSSASRGGRNSNLGFTSS